MNTAATKLSLRFPNKRGERLVFALPQTNHYQDILDLTLPKFRLYLIGENRVSIFTLNDVKKEIKIDLQIKLKPHTMTINKNYKISDYAKNTFSPNRFVNGEDKKVKKLANKVVRKEKNLGKIIKNLYLFTRKYLAYGNPTEGLYTYKQAIEERITDCGGFSTFLAALLASQNIPSRLVVGYIVKPNIFQKLFPKYSTLDTKRLRIHAWLETMLPDSSWFPIDPSTGKFGSIPSNRLVTSFGYDFNIKIDKKNYQIDLLQNPIYI